VEITAEDLAGIPPGNLRVPLPEFGAVWAAAERRCVELGERGVTDDWYPAAVAVTCGWLAAAVVRPEVGRPFLARSPVTGRTASAYEELIEAEYLAAEQLDVRCPDLLVDRPGWCEGVRATLHWAWRRSGPPPLPLPAPHPPF
jgi:hypothetical protein